MTYGFRPENWSIFQAELEKRGIEVADIERLEFRPDREAAVAAPSHARLVKVVVTLRSGRAESWHQPHTAV